MFVLANYQNCSFNCNLSPQSKYMFQRNKMQICGCQYLPPQNKIYILTLWTDTFYWKFHGRVILLTAETSMLSQKPVQKVHAAHHEACQAIFAIWLLTSSLFVQGCHISVYTGRTCGRLDDFYRIQNASFDANIFPCNYRKCEDNKCYLFIAF
jgi:hypothetical protein